MGRITRNKLVKGYHKIFDYIYDTPTASIIDIAHTTNLSRNTVSKYLKVMDESHVMIGPEIRMKKYMTTWIVSKGDMRKKFGSLVLLSTGVMMSGHCIMPSKMV